jgi:GTPase SAR1 family protein
MTDLQLGMDQVRQDILSLADGLTVKGAEYELPSPPDALAICRRRLADKTYQVLVVGEVKRGKSSFVNALIGQDILPTDVDVATSQVFRVNRAAREAYRLRFEDGTAQDRICLQDGTSREMRRDDLPRYGSQVVADVEGTPRRDQIIRWIEIDVPVRFLSPGVSILDTPGLGGLYEYHAEITQRHIPQADAIIFVLDSSRPIVDQELQYVDEILKRTSSVFFIQTKIDLFRSHQWQDVQRRNQEILRERFTDRLTDSRVWPISSRLLRRAAAQGDLDAEIASKHRELASALQTFLFRVAGWTRAAEALIVANEFYTQSSRILADRHLTITNESKQKREEAQKEVARRNEVFIDNWGDRGQERRKLKEAIKKVATLGKAHINQFLARGGELETSLQRKVAAADSLDGLRSIADHLSSDASARAMKAWREVHEQCWQQCLSLLVPFLKAVNTVEDLNAPQAVAAENDLYPIVPAPKITRDWYAKLKGARIDFMTGSSVGAITGAILITLGVITWPIAGIGALIGGILAAFRGTKNIDQNQLRAAQQEVARHVSEACQQLRQYFLEVNFAAGNYSPVDEFFASMERIADEQVETITRRKETEAKTEIARLKKEAELTQQQRKVEAEQLRVKILAWNAFGLKVHDADEKLRALDHAAGGSSSANSSESEKPGGPSAAAKQAIPPK